MLSIPQYVYLFKVGYVVKPNTKVEQYKEYLACYKEMFKKIQILDLYYAEKIY